MGAELGLDGGKVRRRNGGGPRPEQKQPVAGVEKCAAGDPDAVIAAAGFGMGDCPDDACWHEAGLAMRLSARVLNWGPSMFR